MTPARSMRALSESRNGAVTGLPAGFPTIPEENRFMKEQASTIIRLGPEDAGDLAALERLCFSTFWDEARYRNLLASARPVNDAFGDFSAFGLRAHDASLAAFAVLGVNPEEVEIYNIAVRPDLRHTGLGKALLWGVLESARIRGIGRAVLEVRVGNAPALGLYRTLGFSECGRRKAYYADTGEDALVLCLTLAENKI